MLNTDYVSEEILKFSIILHFSLFTIAQRYASHYIIINLKLFGHYYLFEGVQKPSDAL